MGAKKLRTIWRRWRAETIVYCLLLSLAVAVLLTAVVHAGFGWSLWVAIPLFAGCFGVGLLIFPLWRMGVADVTSYLDRRLPELEESCGLLLRPVEELGVLERLQVERVEGRLLVAVVPRPMGGRLLWALGLLAMALCGSFFISGIQAHGASGVAAAPVIREVAAPGIRSVQVRITPPAYTGRALRSQDNFSLDAEDGAQISWEIATTRAVDTVAFIFNDTAVRLLRREEGLRWRFSSTALHSGFYQVKVGGQLSALYRFEVVKDEAPKVRVVRPKPYTVIDYGEPTRVPLQVELADDYGIVASSVFATVSSGKGEAVKFKEQELHWNQGFDGGRHYALSRVLDLAAIGLKPGDELYFYCKARDNRGQESRSEMYILSLADTAQLMSLEGMTLPMDIKPELFRSERQIIIETEQLLKAKDTLAAQAFKDKSNDLGIDQKLLRLRYGKFLGEEAQEGERGGNDTTTFGAFGDAAKILDVYSDKHDNAEDATFFEPGVKAQLKATLSEMWSAELRLRTFKPREALPYCYKALRLLKDLQQQSRAYVAKTGVKLTPLNPARRLTGELGAIQAPVQRLGRDDGMSKEDILRMGLAVLEGMRVGVRPGEGDRAILGMVERRLASEAAARPGKFLAGYEGMRRLKDILAAETMKGEAGPGAMDILAAERAIVALLPVAEAWPVAQGAAADGGLERLYFGYIK
ncbi:DUF4175 family protein [Puia sp.]|uniref:DUF4175 family protein n=1 Tax=Puia sp. TaxID=2045100 RepID=UPI002F3F1DD3